MATAQLTGTAPLRTRGALAALATAALTLLPVPAAAAEESPPAAHRYEAGEPATALVNPATVFLVATWTGVVRDRATGDPVSTQPIEVRRRCSAVAVNPAGYAVTTALCVRPSPEVLVANALSLEGRIRVSRGELTEDRIDAFVTERVKQATFTGADRDQPPAAVLESWVDRYQEGADDARGVRAAVTYAQPATEGNVAVVKLGRSGLPSVEVVAGDTVREGDTVVLSGFSGDGKPQQLYALRNRTTTVGGRDGTNRLTVDGAIGSQARGGGVVDPSGRLVALQDADISTAGEPVRDLILAGHIQRALSAAKVTAAIGDVDRAYRAGLADYFAGRFTQAVTRFDALLAGTPDYRAARTYRDRAVARRDVDGDAVVNAADWPTYVLSAAAGVVILVLLHALGRLRRRKDKDPAETMVLNLPKDDTVILKTDDTVVLELDQRRFRTDRP